MYTVSMKKKTLRIKFMFFGHVQLVLVIVLHVGQLLTNRLTRPVLAHMKPKGHFGGLKERMFDA
eukprot:UN09814